MHTSLLGGKPLEEDAREIGAHSIYAACFEHNGKTYIRERHAYKDGSVSISTHQAYYDDLNIFSYADLGSILRDRIRRSNYADIGAEPGFVKIDPDGAIVICFGNEKGAYLKSYSFANGGDRVILAINGLASVYMRKEDGSYKGMTVCPLTEEKDSSKKGFQLYQERKQFDNNLRVAEAVSKALIQTLEKAGIISEEKVGAIKDGTMRVAKKILTEGNLRK